MKKFMIAFLFIAFYAAYLLFTKLLFGDDNLICIKGKLPKYFQLVETKTVSSSNLVLAYLVFKLDKDNRIYTSKVDITGVENGDDIFSGVALAIQDADEIEVYIKKAEIAGATPKVYQIKADGKEIFNIIKKSANNSNLFLMMLFFTLLFCSAYYWLQCLSITTKKPNRKNKWAFEF